MSKKIYKIFTINPGSTSTKIALFEGDKKTFSANVTHDAKRLDEFKELVNQLDFRVETILDALEKENINISDCDAFVGRGPAIYQMQGGTYDINSLMKQHAIDCVAGVVHPCNLGCIIADSFAEKYNKPAFIVNAPSTDEYQDLARMTGIKNIYRYCFVHALNAKETAIRHADSLGKVYNECNLIVCHLGGGISLTAHKNGKMIDGFNATGGEGPMSPTRCGSVGVDSIVNLCYHSDLSEKNMHNLSNKSGGFVSHLGVSDSQEVVQRAQSGDQYSSMLWDTMIYQIEKSIGALATVLRGRVDGILLTGGITHDKKLVSEITDCCSWIAEVTAYPGEFEMEAMASGAIRVLSGKEESKVYTGKPTFNGFNFPSKEVFVNG